MLTFPQSPGDSEVEKFWISRSRYVLSVSGYSIGSLSGVQGVLRVVDSDDSGPYVFCGYNLFCQV